MSETKTALQKVKETLELCKKYIAKFGSAEQKFTDAKLADGVTVVRFPNAMPVKGDAVTVITDQGELPMPDSAADMPYKMQNGTTFTVVNGLVDVVMEPETPAEDKTEVADQTATAAAASAAAPKRVIKSNVEEHVFNLEIEGIEKIKVDFSDAFKFLADKISALESENKTLNEKISAQFELTKGLSETVEFLADEPATKSAEDAKLKTKKFEDMTALEQHRYLKSKQK